MRIDGRIQLSTDGWEEYPPAVSFSFGNHVDYAQVIKPVKPIKPNARGYIQGRTTTSPAW